MTIQYKVVKSVPPDTGLILGGMNQGEEFSRITLVTKNPDKTYKQILTCINNSLQSGVIKEMNKDWYEKLDTIHEWRSTLARTRLVHFDPGRRGTRDTYSRALGRFNSWLADRAFDVITYKDDNTVRGTISFANVEEMVHYLAGPAERTRHIQGIIKKYLHDPIHEGKKASSVKVVKNAIISYLSYHDYEIHLKFDAKRIYNSDIPHKEFTLYDMQMMLQTSNRRDRAILICKFQRGLDLSTLVDSFNYEAFGQISDYFGTTDYTQWDPGRCPIPIKLVRIKTKYEHMGFIDIDALRSLMSYLNERTSKGHKIGRGLPLFVSKRGTGISSNAVIHIFENTANRAGLRDGPVKVGSHEVRDLLKSTLINAGCRWDVADHVIGHKPKDSYEKQTSLYPETVRAEYAKASKWINVLSKEAGIVNSGAAGEASKLEERMKRLEEAGAENTRREAEQLEIIKELKDMLKMAAKQDVDSLR